ncbi:MAG: YeeE/YedE thiosulfate transporter family protein [Candidatus Kapaibacterium sp.]
MIAPFFKYNLFGVEFSLVVAFAIGLLFGFFLERAGFGNARKLALQFYLKDLTVFKVMFTAIITAMLGVLILSGIGFLDYSLIYISDTYLAPQIVGGVLLGLGFVVGGYCPGTSVVAFATGKLDGIVFIIGVMFGIFIFGELYPVFEGFFMSGHMGKVTLPELLGLEYGLVVFIVVILALLGFAGAEWVERKIGFSREKRLDPEKLNK